MRPSRNCSRGSTKPSSAPGQKKSIPTRSILLSHPPSEPVLNAEGSLRQDGTAMALTFRTDHVDLLGGPLGSVLTAGAINYFVPCATGTAPTMPIGHGDPTGK